jgi:hypothetical protein
MPLEQAIIQQIIANSITTLNLNTQIGAAGKTRLIPTIEKKF